MRDRRRSSSAETRDASYAEVRNFDFEAHPYREAFSGGAQSSATGAQSP